MEGQKSTEDLAADVRQWRSKRNISNSVLFLEEQVAEISQPISFALSALTLHVTKLYITKLPGYSKTKFAFPNFSVLCLSILIFIQ